MMRPAPGTISAMALSRRLVAAEVVFGMMLVGCLPGDRVVRAEVANFCDFGVNVRLGFTEGALNAVAPDDVGSNQTEVLEAVYPGPSTPLYFAVSPVVGDEPRVVLPEKRADKNDRLRITLADSVCAQLRPS